MLFPARLTINLSRMSMQCYGAIVETENLSDIQRAKIIALGRRQDGQTNFSSRQKKDE